MIRLEGQLEIDLLQDATGVRQAQIRSGRPLHASRILEGLVVEEALQRLPLIFSLCATAQAATALRACEEALAITPSTANQQAREMLVWMESAREHLLRIMLDWPAYTDETVEQDRLPELMQLLPALSRALYGDSAPFSLNSMPMPDVAAAQQAITHLRELIGSLIGAALPDSRSYFADWLKRGETLPARLLQQLRESGWDQLGQGNTSFMPFLESDALHERLTTTEADAFLAEPVWQGSPCETTPLQRQQSHPLIKELLASEGNGLLTRLTARLAELQLIPDLLQLGLKRLTRAPTATARYAVVSGIGMAQVEAARGRLFHRVEIEEKRVRRYQILAPTEWNFHPQGVAMQGLLTLTGNDEDALKKQAMLWLNAIDPCVGIKLQVRHDA